MADKTINDLTATTTLNTGDLFELENTGNNSRKITAANAAKAFRTLSADGCLVYLNTTIAAVNATAGYSIPFAAASATEAYDDNGYHDLSSNTTRLTIPSGADGRYIIFAGVFYTGGTSADYWRFTLKKNGGDFGGMPWQHGEVTSTVGIGASIVSPPVPLVAADYVEAQLTVESDTSITLQANYTYFGLKRVI